MNMVDIWRSILIGQAAWIFVWLGLIWWMRMREKPRPGFIIGITAFSVGDLAAIIYLVVLTFNRIGQPCDYRTYLATIAVVSENLGAALIALHLFFHDDELSVKVKRLFHVVPPTPKPNRHGNKS